MKLRVNGINQTDTPLEIKQYFQQFGEVQDVAIYASESLTYAVIEMPESDADTARCSKQPMWKEKNFLQVKIANRYRGKWIFSTWRPPQKNCR